MFNKGFNFGSYIVSAAVVSLAVSQAFVSPAVYLVATESGSSISNPVSVPDDVPGSTPTPTPTPTPFTCPDNADCATPISNPVVIPTDNGNNGGGGGSSDSGSGGGSNGGGGSTACNDTKPGSAPVLYSVSNTGPNQVTLRWLKAKTPVSYYAITYGLIPGKQQYGNPYVGNANTTSYTVTHLSGGATYYFKVRAGNGCMPGDFSNEMSNRASGSFKSGPAGGFIPGVLGVSKVKPTPAPTSNTETQTPQPTSKPQSNFVVNFIKSFVSFFSN